METNLSNPTTLQAGFGDNIINFNFKYVIHQLMSNIGLIGGPKIATKVHDHNMYILLKNWQKYNIGKTKWKYTKFV